MEKTPSDAPWMTIILPPTAMNLRYSRSVGVMNSMALSRSQRLA